MPDIYMDVDTAVTIPVNKVPIVASSDGYTIDETIAYNESGMDLNWNFVTTAGVQTQTNVVPTTGDDHDWTHVGNGIYKVEMPATLGDANNNAEGFGWFSGKADAICPFSGPIIGFRAAALNNLLIDDAYSTTRGLAGTALPNAAADASGGLPISDDGGLDLDAMNVQLDDNFDEILNVKTQTDKFIFTVANQVNANVIGISGDNTAADNLELMYDGTGYAGGTIKQDVKIVSASQTALDAILKTTTFALAIADAIADEVISKSEHNVANSLAKKIRGIEHVTVLHEGQAQGAGGGDNTIELAETASAVNDWYKDDWIMLVEGTGENQMHHIESYVGSTRIATLGENWLVNPDSSTDYVVIAQSSVHVHRFEQAAKDEINAEMVDALNVDTYAEPGQETPAATASLVKKIGYMYKFLRNKITDDGTNIKVYNDAGAVVDQKNTVGESGGTVTRGKFGTGP